jgi:tetratricopeptide (TPR) repeat protein
LNLLLSVASTLVISLWVTEVQAQTAPPAPDLTGTEKPVRDVIEQQRKVVQSRPGDAAAWGRLGMLFEAHSHFEPAKICYREANRLDADEFRWAYFLASLYDYSDAKLALEWHQKALALKPNYAPARLRTGEALEKLGRADEALVEFEKAIELDSGNALARLGAGRVLLRQGQIDRAVGQLEKAYQAAPEMQAVVATLARAYHRAGKDDLARVRAQEARSLPRTRSSKDPIRAEIRDLAQDLESYLRRARTMLEVGNLDQAAALIQELLVISPNHGEAHLMLASVENERGRSLEAVAAARRALEVDPSLETRARSVLAGSLFKLGKFDEAEPQVTRVLAREPDNFHMLLLNTMLAGQRGDAAALVANLDRAWQARTADPALRQVLGGVLRDVVDSFAAAGGGREAAHFMEQVVQLAVEDRAPESVLSQYRARLAELRKSAR